MEEVVVDQITNEELRKRFKNQFELVNYAIKIAENLITTGRAPRVEVDIQNPVIQALKEISSGKDLLDSVLEGEEEDETIEMEIDSEELGGTAVAISEESLEEDQLRVSKKKGRKALVEE